MTSSASSEGLSDRGKAELLDEALALPPSTQAVLCLNHDGWAPLFQACTLQIGVKFIRLVGVPSAVKLWRTLHSANEPHVAPSPRDDQVQALLGGDLSCLNTPSRTRDQQDSSSSRTASFWYSEYEYYRSSSRPVQRHSNPDDDVSETKSTTNNSGSSVEEVVQQRRKSVMCSEYVRFRRKMQRIHHHINRHSQCEGDENLKPTIIESQATERNDGGKSQSTDGVSKDRQYVGNHPTFSAFSAGIGAKEELGQVKGLIGTVLGRYPPTNSPFFLAKASGTSTSGSVASSALELSDGDSVEIMFDGL